MSKREGVKVVLPALSVAEFRGMSDERDITLLDQVFVEVSYPEGCELRAIEAVRRATQLLEQRLGPQWNAPDSAGAEWGR